MRNLSHAHIEKKGASHSTIFRAHAHTKKPPKGRGLVRLATNRYVVKANRIVIYLTNAEPIIMFIFY